MPVEAELDWMIIVTASPMASAPITAPKGMIPPTGVQSKRANSCCTEWKPPIPVSSSLMISIPKKRNPKPSTVSPIPRRFFRRMKLSSRPTMIAGIARTPTSNETICAVIVVPILDPMMIPIDWARFRSPALMKPITMTVVALED